MATEATGLLLGGGAPTLTLQSGALAALHDNVAAFVKGSDNLEDGPATGAKVPTAMAR